MSRTAGALFAIGSAIALSASPLAAQAFTAPQGLGAVTLGWQYVDNTGHRVSDGLLQAIGPSVTMSVLFEMDYAITDRLSATAGVPYVSARYTGSLPSFSRLPRDECRCWNSALQDVSLAARYRFGSDTRALTPALRIVLPTHDYPYEGEAVVGRNLRELQFGLNAGLRLLEKTALQAGYTYAFVEKPLRDISIDRSNLVISLGYAATSRLYINAAVNGNHTHGGLRIGSPTGRPFFPPGELNTPERFAQRDRVLSTQYWQAGGGAAYSLGSMDVFVSYMKYVWGRDAHDGHVYTIGTTWYFDRSKI